MSSARRTTGGLLALVSTMVVSVALAHGQEPASCEQTAQSIDGEPGTTVALQCPPGCGLAPIWGTGVYSDDSSICSAAIHAGVIGNAGGEVTVEILPGQVAYRGSLRFGIFSQDWDVWERSFAVGPTWGPPQLTCGDTAEELPGEPGDAVVVSCPEGCASSRVWGMKLYSDDSAVCVAAVHAGVIGDTGGDVVVTIAPGQLDYPSVTSNGITSSEWGSWHRSFNVGVP